MGLVDGLAGGLGLKNDFKAKRYGVNDSAYIDPNAAANKQSLAAALAQRQGMAGPQMSATTAGATPYDAAQQAQFRGQQMGLAQQLTAQASGGGPSLAGMQLQQGLDKAIASQRAQAASARGVSPGLAQRLAANNIAQLQGDASRDAAMTRMQEQMNAQQTLGGLLSGARGQDIGMAGEQAQLGQQLSLANAGFQNQAGAQNLSALLQEQANKDQMAQFYTGSGLGIDANSFAAQQAGEQAKQQAFQDWQAMRAGISGQNAQARTQLVGGLISAGGAAGAAAIGAPPK